MKDGRDANYRSYLDMCISKHSRSQRKEVDILPELDIVKEIVHRYGVRKPRYSSVDSTIS